MLNISSMSELWVELQNHKWPLFRSSSERLCFLLPKEKHSINFNKHLYKHIVPASYGHGCNTERTASQMRLKSSWWMKGQLLRRMPMEQRWQTLNLGSGTAALFHRCIHITTSCPVVFAGFSLSVDTSGEEEAW